MLRYEPKQEQEILNFAADALREDLPEMPADKLRAAAEMLNNTGITTVNGRVWTVNNLRIFLWSRKKTLCLMAGKTVERNKVTRRRTRAKRTTTTPATKATFTGAALNGSGDIVRSILEDMHTTAETKVSLLKTYMTEATA